MTGQVNKKPILRDDHDLARPGRKLSARAVANYIAKYATKDFEIPGLPARPLTTRLDADGLRCPAHNRRMILAAWELGGGQLTAGLRPSLFVQGGELFRTPRGTLLRRDYYNCEIWKPAIAPPRCPS